MEKSLHSAFYHYTPTRVHVSGLKSSVFIFLFLNDQEDSPEIPEEKEKLTIFWLRTNQSVIHNHEYTSLVEFDG